MPSLRTLSVWYDILYKLGLEHKRAKGHGPSERCDTPSQTGYLLQHELIGSRILFAVRTT